MLATLHKINYSGIFDTISEPYIVVSADDPKFTVVAHNKSHADATNLDKNDVIGRGLFRVLPQLEKQPEGVESFIETLRETKRTARTHTLANVVYPVYDGKYPVRQHWNVRMTPIEEDDEVIAIAMKIEDVLSASGTLSAKTKPISQLTEITQGAYALANSMPHMVWVAGSNGDIEYYNDRWYEYTGIKRGATGDIKWEDVIYPEDIERATECWNESIKSNTVFTIEFRIYNSKTDSYRWVISRAEPYIDSSGKVISWYGTSTDIHDRKHVSEMQSFLLEVSKKLSSTLEFDKILKNICDLCVPKVADWCSIDMLNEQGGFDQVGVAHSDSKKVSEARKFREYNPIDASQKSGVPNVVRTNELEFYPVITDEMIEMGVDDPRARAFMKKLSLRSIIIAPLRINQKPVGAITLVASRSDHTFTDEDVRLVEILSARISLAITNAKLYADSLKDLKERKRLQHELVREKQRLEMRVKERTQQLILTNDGLREEVRRRLEVEKELAEYSESLAHSNKELEDFAYVASHDLQEPLRKIQAFSNLLINEQQDRLDEDGLDYLKRMQSAASRMSTLIQDLLSFSRVSTRQQQAKQVNLSKVAKDVMSDLETRVKETDADVKIGDLPTVLADPTHMHQLLQNIIANAIKFHKPNVKPSVIISSSSRNGWAEITIKDNGIGFDQQYSDKIFDVFQRLNGRSEYEGTGIGLAVCRKIVEKYEGNISVQSKSGHGTTFMIRMPLSMKGKSL